jgi:hypothetical protein
MFAALLLDHRLAFVFLAALILGAAVPLAVAWARVLPEEPPPFTARSKRAEVSIYDPESLKQRRDPLSIALLVCVSLSYAVRLPSLPRSLGFGSIPIVLPQDSSAWLHFALTWFLVVVPGFGAVYSLLRPNFLRVPLIAAGTLVLLLWLLSAPLRAALEAIT